MRGLDEARRFYAERGQAMIRSRFPDYEGRIAVGLAGRGSQCFGYDDALSRDHDFEQGFCLWLTDEDDLKIGVALAREYRSLGAEGPRERSALGSSGVGVQRIGDFYRRYTGSPGAPESWQQWMSLPSWALAEAVNGEVFYDGPGEVTAIRERLSAYPPDILRKKLAGRLLLMGQAGQYNYPRCLAHGEKGAAQLAVGDFVRHCMGAVFLLNGVYQPYYKWAFRALRALPRLSLLAELMEYLLTTDNDGDMAAAKRDVIEGMAADVIAEARRQGLTGAECDDLEQHARSVNDQIADGEVRNLHILAAV